MNSKDRIHTAHFEINPRKALICAVIIMLLFGAAGCKKPEPARLIIAVQGGLFSDAVVMVDGKQVGKLTGTLIKPDGQLFIDGVYQVTLPPGHRDIPEQDEYSGALDSLQFKAGDHTILFTTDDGKTLEIKGNIPPGMHVVTYYSAEEKLVWNQTTMKASPGTTVTVTLPAPK